MKKPSPSAGNSSTCSGGGGRETKFKGVRRRKWGKWVSEVRLPNSRERIWLGSYDSPEKAARAFDAAAFCLRGRRAGLNFPDDVPDVPGPRLSHQQIQAAAARHAHSYAPYAASASDPASASEPPAASPPSSDGPAVEDLTAMDWSFLDLMADATADFGYGFFPPTAANSDAAAAEDGGGNLSLWNF